MAKLYFRYGAMNSGKSTALMQVAHNYEERGMRVFVIKPAVDTKGGDMLVSRLGVRRKADASVHEDTDVFALVRTDIEVNGTLACVLADESQFFTPQQADDLFRVTVKLQVPVICYGLRTDFSLRGFPGSTRLLELAHNIEEMKTICQCGRKALCNGRKANGKFVFEGAQIAIDMENDVAYESLCPQCYFREREKFFREKETLRSALQRVTERIYMFPGEDFTGRDRSFLYYVRGDRLCLAVDAGNSPAHVQEFYTALNHAGLPLPDITVITHWHWDHSFGLSAVKGLTIASVLANQMLRNVQNWKWDDVSIEARLLSGEDIPACVDCIRREYADLREIRVIPASAALERPITLDLGGVTCQIIPHDSPHSRDGLFLYFPEEKALAAGDGDCGDYYALDGAYDAERLKDFLTFLQSLDYKWALLGHDFPRHKTEQLADLYEISKNSADTL